MRTSYTVGFIINVIKYSKSITGQLKDILVHLLLQNMLMEKARQELPKLEKKKHFFCTYIAKWSDRESDVKKWITVAKNNRISVPKI